jgi:hypothetical protein
VALKQELQNILQTVQMAHQIYNSEIEPEHESNGYCDCDIHEYKFIQMNRLGVQELWSKAVMYPGEHRHANVSYSALQS